MSLEHIGQKLKAAREAQGFSLRQIYDKTKIPIAHLQSIDGGQPQDLPEPVYVAGFIKRYADCVGLNGDSISEEYRKEAETYGNGQSAWGNQVLTSSPIMASPAYLAKTKIDSGPPGFKTIWFNMLCVVVLVALIGYLAMTVTNNNQSNQQDPSLLSLKEATAKLSANAPQTTTAAPSTAQAGAAQPGAITAPATDNSGPQKITLSASQHVWVEVKSTATGASLFTGYLEQGDHRDFEDAQGLRVRAGNGGSLTVAYAGKNEVMGLPGKVTERVYAAASTASPEKEIKTASTLSTSSPGATPVKSSKRTHRAADAQLSSSRDGYRELDNGSSRQYIPGESLGRHSRSFDVPYRYTEGRLDAE